MPYLKTVLGSAPISTRDTIWIVGGIVDTHTTIEEIAMEPMGAIILNHHTGSVNALATHAMHLSEIICTCIDKNI
jgi:hypothetical protein